MQLNKIASIKTISLVASELGEDEDFLWDIAGEMEPEDGVIWVNGVGEHGVMAFSDFGVGELQNLIQIYREDQK